MEVYQPDAVVLQCGDDSLAGDRLGCFNLSVHGRADCLRFLRSFNVPLMILGGGGYTIIDIARCWCYETAIAVGIESENKLPDNGYYVVLLMLNQYPWRIRIRPGIWRRSGTCCWSNSCIYPMHLVFRFKRHLS